MVRCGLSAGAALVRNCSGHVLSRFYFGGGTVDVSLTTANYRVHRQNLSHRLDAHMHHVIGCIIHTSHCSLHCYVSLDWSRPVEKRISYYSLMYTPCFKNNSFDFRHSKCRPISKLLHWQILRRPECLVCNRQQWAREGPGARKITSIALRRSTGGSSAS